MLAAIVQTMRAVIGLLALCTLVALLGPVMEGRERSAERAVRGYLEAIQAGDVNAALEMLEPSVRPEWRIFVEHQAGDQFRVVGLSVQRAALLSGLPHWGIPRSVTLTAAIAGKGGEHWQATARVPGRPDGDRWYAERPPFAPDEPWLVPPDS
jgi:hypothetical protein